MRDCPECGNSYPEPFRYCPVDGAELEAAQEEADESYSPQSTLATSISLRTLLLALGFLVLLTIFSFTGSYLYLYLKPRYGGLVVKTTPPGATIFVNDKQRGVSPLTVGELRSGGHQIKALKEGYKDYIQHVEVIPNATENLHWTLEPLVPHLSNEQLAEIESWRKKLDNAQRENILLPPPEDYNVLYFANRVLAIDPANTYALEVKSKLAERLHQSADVAYAQEDWLEAEKQYKNLALIFPNEISINERLADIAGKIDASVKDREKQIADWTSKAEAAMKAGNLVPPEKDNAFEALNNIQRLDKKNVYARGALIQLKEVLQNRGDTKISNADWQGARSDFKLVLQYFLDDNYSKSRLAMVEGKLADLAQAEQQRIQRMQEEPQPRQQAPNLRQAAIHAYRSGSYDKAILDWQEYLKMEPNSDEAYFFVGASYVEQKQFDTGILNFEKCLALNANNALAHMNLGFLYDRHRNDLARAMGHLRKVKELGGVDRYSPERIQAMIQDLQQRAHLDALQKSPYAAEHKHAFSSCRGNLRIAAGGVEFKTTETDHSFYEAYGSLRSFSVQGDDLALRTRTNKKYNFHLLNQGDGALIRKLAARHTQVTE